MMDDIVVSWRMNTAVSWCFVSVGIVALYRSIVGAFVSPYHWSHRLSFALFFDLGLWLLYIGKQRLAGLEKELAGKNAEVSKLQREKEAHVEGKQRIAELEKELAGKNAEVSKLQMEKEAHEEYARKTLRKFQEKNGSLVVDCNAKLKEKNDETEAMLQDFKAQLKEIIDEKIDAFLQTKKLGDEAPVQSDA